MFTGSDVLVVAAELRGVTILVHRDERAQLQEARPMNLKGHYPKHHIWGGAQPDIERIVEILTDCLARYGGPFLFGKRRGLADAMYAPVVKRFLTYDVPLDAACKRYCAAVMAMPEMKEWVDAAKAEPDDIELDMEFQPTGGLRLLRPGRRLAHLCRRRHVDVRAIGRPHDLGGIPRRASRRAGSARSPGAGARSRRRQPASPGLPARAAPWLTKCRAPTHEAFLAAPSGSRSQSS